MGGHCGFLLLLKLSQNLSDLDPVQAILYHKFKVFVHLLIGQN